MYLIRGTAELTTGYRVRFTEVVPALRSGLSFLPPVGGTVAGATSDVAGESTTNLAQAPGLHLGTFTPPPTEPLPTQPPTPTNPPLLSPTFPSQQLPPSTSGCRPSVSQLEPLYELDGVQFGRSVLTGGLDPNLYGYWYYVRNSSITTERQVLDIVRRISRQLELDPGQSETVGAIGKRQRSYEDILAEFRANNDCPVRISGPSPSLYLYPKQLTTVTISLGSPLTYTDPTVNNNSWSILSQPDGTLSESGIKNYESWEKLYYEYDKRKITFTEPSEGFVVKRGEWEAEVRNIASHLKLTSKETEDLVTDVRNTLIDVKDSPYLKISFVDRKEIDEKLPMTISPKPDIFHRVHLYLTPLSQLINILQPTIVPLERNGFTALELGVAAKE
ncbi:hypothetical protein HY008_02860 [Candidatus Woesebacteria bacterium]|nr:hypothetical protein [Candidatus Woesebacteria bacterium]